MQRAVRKAEEEPHKLLPLHETPTGKNNPSIRVNKPFSYQEIQRNKEDLGDCLEYPEKYIRTVKGFTLLYDFTWQNVIYILGQTLTPDSKTRVLEKVIVYEDEWLGYESTGKREEEIVPLLLVRLVKAMVFPVVMYGCECWTVKKAERQKN